MTYWGNNRVFRGRLIQMNRLLAPMRMGLLVVVCFFLFATSLPSGQIVSTQPAITTEAYAESPVIVIGFVGGFIKRDNLVHSEVQLAARLRQEYPTGVNVETFESYHRKEARQRILEILDSHHTGAPSAEEKEKVRIILYGHSWGGSEVVLLARALEKDGIPVLLTLQIDSVSKPGRNGTIISANVARAVNFYQSQGLLRGDHDIRAADPARTEIIGNFQFDYKKSSLKCSDYPWYDRIITKAHTQIECDPIVWKQAESLIRSSLLPLRAQSILKEDPLHF
jgi:hypothetical protein